MTPKLTVITLCVDNFPVSLKFYRDGLGWEAKQPPGGDIAFFPLNGIVLAIYPRAAFAKEGIGPVDGSDFSGVTCAINTASPEEVDALFARLPGIGAKILKQPEKVFWGGYSGYFADPDGHIWEVAHNPFWELDKNGSVVMP